MPFVDSERGQAIQIGALILFGAVIISFATYQAFVVPDQNRQVEFNHFSDTQDDMEELRNGVIRAGQTGSSVPAGIDLGISYPSRLVASQPVGSFGALRTSRIGGTGTTFQLQNAGGESMADVCGISSPTTRATVYQPSYTYLDSVGNITYENTVVYTSGRREGRSFQTDQQLVESDTVHVYPLVGDVQESGMDRSTITFRGGETGENASIEGSFDLVVPTRLSVSQWQDLLSNQTQVTGVSDVAGQQAVRISFAAGETYTVRCSPVGAGRAPNNEPAVGVPDEDVNPNFGTDVILENVTAGNLSNSLATNEVVLQFNNTDDQESQSITQIRFPFYAPGVQNGTDQVPLNFSTGGTVVERLGRLRSVQVDFAPGETRNVTLAFRCDVPGTFPYDVQSGDTFATTAVFASGDDRTYRAVVTNGGSSTDARCPSDTSGSLSDASVTDIGTSTSETQRFTFTPAQDYTSSDTVTIDLSNANGNNKVDYSAATATVSTGPGTASITAGGDTLTYDASGSEAAGEQIVIDVSNIDASGNQATMQDPFTVTFTGPDGETKDRTFTVG